ncbi:DUF3099 domain-containing protein [Kocuria rhizophila]|nr:DUF3099 domain-containing protein [Kocuria rhizophila]
MSHRMKVYGVQMALRVACIIGVFLIDNLTVRAAILGGRGAAVARGDAREPRADRSQRTGSR